MGAQPSSETDLERQEETQEYLDQNPSFLSNYIQRNMHLLDNFVLTHCDEAKVKEWLDKVESPPPTVTLKLLKVDFRKHENTSTHRTDQYIHNNLVIRRSAKFKLDLVFTNRKFLPAKDKIDLKFWIGNKPSEANGTQVKLTVGDSLQRSKWGAMLLSADPELKTASVQVNIPPDAIVGRYKFAVLTTSQLASGPETVTKVESDILVIFNPFSPEDDVYMADAEQRQEYVLNDTGTIYVGQYYRIGGRDWLFGQFEDGILDIVLKMLREDPRARKNPLKSLRKRASPVFCSRVLSAMVNCNDDDGVLWGNWSGDYKGGERPSSWSGSVKILKHWSENKMAPVKWGQCWVFSGVLTTALRAIGIPARPVTNFSSAHDTEYNMTIDRFVDEDGEDAGDRMGNGDSIWNFHVWNDAWFRRRDLPTGYDGWQALDSTPQEESGGIMQCGPAPLAAIQNGDIYVGQDTNFLFAEVNADIVYWKVNQDLEVTGLVKRNSRQVGKSISTKAVGRDRREDITLQYKHPEGSEDERRVFERAYAHSRKADYHDKFVIAEEGAITIDISSEGDVVNGQPVVVKIKISNTTKNMKDVIVNTVLNSMLNKDERKALIKRKKVEVDIPGGQMHEQVLKVKFSDYGHLITDHNVIRATTTVRVKQTDNLYVDHFDFQLDAPDCLVIKCSDSLKQWVDNEVRFVVTNPLPVPLTGAVFNLDGSGLSTKSLIIKDPIGPGETFETPPMQVTPYRRGRIGLFADLDATEIMNVKARKFVYVSS